MATSRSPRLRATASGRRVRAVVRLHWLCPVPTHYHAHLFRAVAAEGGVPLTVHFLRAGQASHPWRATFESGFSARVIKPRLGVDPVLHEIVEREPRSLFVVAGWHGTVAMSVLAHLMVRRRPFCIWSDTPNLSVRHPRATGVLRAIWVRTVLG